MDTDILPIDAAKLGQLSSFPPRDEGLVQEWDIEYNDQGEDMKRLKRAAQELAATDVPVAFPTETVYGLGADATRSSAVKAIFAAKGRPADNPLIVHVHSIAQLRSLLRGSKDTTAGSIGGPGNPDPIPSIYKPLIRKFWPGPLTIILPNPDNSVLAPEVTAGLNTFGARMPRSILALALIRLADMPLAAPSANASTRPSPTAAEHVKDDLDTRIRTILDGGPCEVGVESTVVDGLSSPPAILRPGGITVEQLRQCPGWEDVVVGYKDVSENGMKPRAPGMKYRHYSPKATVFLYELGKGNLDRESFLERAVGYKTVGIIRTKTWPVALGLPVQDGLSARSNETPQPSSAFMRNGSSAESPQSNLLRSLIQHQIPHAEQLSTETGSSARLDVWDINLGAETEHVARGLFSALRELDKKEVEAIFVEGIEDKAGDDIAAAVMNRLRKAAQVQI
jgi:L-threonylcarbamoyladenylate synthase